MSDDEFLLDLLNTTPVRDGGPTDLLAAPGVAHGWSIARGGTGTPVEVRHLRAVRDALQRIVRGQDSASVLQSFLTGVSQVPTIGAAGISWQVQATPSRRQAVRATIAWAQLQARTPGRLRPCKNLDCSLFLLDRSKSNNARWCSMARCGNRLKARRHYHRTQSAGTVSAG